MMTERRAAAMPDSSPGLDGDIAVLFSLDPRAETVVDLLGYDETSGNCTDNGCTRTCQGC
jgi:hypothetical protein